MAFNTAKNFWYRFKTS